MNLWIRALAAGVLGLGCGAVPAVEIEIGVPEVPNAAVTPTHATGRYVVSWDDAGRIRARTVEADAVGDSVGLFPGRPRPGGPATSPFRYSRHAAAYKTARRRLMAVAQAGYTATLITDYSLELAVFDEALAEVSRRYISLPGVGITAWETELALAADDFDDDCCAMLAYVDKRTPGGGMVLERLDADGNLLGEPMRIPQVGHDGVLSHPRIHYQRRRDHFLLVYETRRDVRARTIAAVSGEPGPEQVVAAKLRPARSEAQVDGKPSVAYSPMLDRYLVTWFDHASGTTATRAVRATFLDGQGRSPLPAFTVAQACTLGDFSCFVQPTAAGAPIALDAGQLFQVVFPARPWGAPEDAAQIASYRVWSTSTTPPQMRWSLATPVDDAHRSHVAAARQSPLSPGLMVYRESFIDPLWTVHSLYGQRH